MSPQPTTSAMDLTFPIPLTTHPSIASTTTSQLNDTYDVSFGTAELLPIVRAPRPTLLKRRTLPLAQELTPPPIPARSEKRAANKDEGEDLTLAATTAPRVLEKGTAESTHRDVKTVREEIGAPVRRRITRVQWLLGDDSDSDSDSSFEEYAEEEEEDTQEADMQAAEAHLRWMHAEWVAGRLFTASAPDPSSPEEREYDPEWETVIRYPKAKEFFDLSADGEHFRNVFLESKEVGEEEAAMRWLDDIFSMVESEEDGGREETWEEIERAMDDESTLGSSPGISPRDTEVLFRHPDDDEVDHDYFAGGDSESGSEGGIHNPVGDQWPVLFREWSVWPAHKSMSVCSDYSSPSRPGSPLLRDGEVMLYSPIGNPWHLGENMLSVSDIEEVVAEQRFISAASDFFAGFEVEALVADSKIPGYELEDHDELKGRPSEWKLDPHDPDMGCRCYWCDRYFHPSLDDDYTKHDPNVWCHCASCEIFRDKETAKWKTAEKELSRIEQDKMWKARMAGLSAAFCDAEDEEESMRLDLLDSLYDKSD